MGKERPLLPQGSGDGQSPEETQAWLWDERARVEQERRMLAFERALDRLSGARKKNRRAFNDYTTKNCEEASGGRGGP